MTDVPAEVEEWITSDRHIAFIATTVDDLPHVAPIWYRYDDGRFRLTTSGAKKISNIKRNPHVAIAIQHDVDGYPEWMALFNGTASVDDDIDRIKQVSRDVYSKYMGGDVDDWPEFYRTQLTDPHPDRAILDIEVESVVTNTY